MDREAWHAVIHGVANSWTRLTTEQNKGADETMPGTHTQDLVKVMHSKVFVCPARSGEWGRESVTGRLWTIIWLHSYFPLSPHSARRGGEGKEVLGLLQSPNVITLFGYTRGTHTLVQNSLWSKHEASPVFPGESSGSGPQARLSQEITRHSKNRGLNYWGKAPELQGQRPAPRLGSRTGG